MLTLYLVDSVRGGIQPNIATHNIELTFWEAEVLCHDVMSVTK